MDKTPNELWINIFLYCPLDVRKLPQVSKLFHNIHKNTENAFMVDFLKSYYNRVCFTGLTKKIYQMHILFYDSIKNELGNHCKYINDNAYKYKSKKKYNIFIKNQLWRRLHRKWNLMNDHELCRNLLKYSKWYRNLILNRPNAMDIYLRPMLRANNYKYLEALLPFYTEKIISKNSGYIIDAIVYYYTYGKTNTYNTIMLLRNHGLGIIANISKLLECSIKTADAKLFDLLYNEYYDDAVPYITMDLIKSYINVLVKFTDDMCRKILSVKTIHVNELMILPSYYQSIQIIQRLLEFGADIHYNNDELFAKAVERSDIDTIKFLLNNGVNAYTQNKKIYNEAVIYAAQDITQLHYEMSSNICEKPYLRKELDAMLSKYNNRASVLNPNHTKLVL